MWMSEVLLTACCVFVHDVPKVSVIVFDAVNLSVARPMYNAYDVPTGVVWIHQTRQRG
jgi:hypothetical protein